MFPRAAPEKPLQINYAARHKFVGAAITGFCALGTAIVYFSDMFKPRDERSPEAVLEKAAREDAYALHNLKSNFKYSSKMFKERQQAIEEKYLPQVMKDVAKHLDEQGSVLKPGQHGDFIVTKTPDSLRQQTEVK